MGFKNGGARAVELGFFGARGTAFGRGGGLGFEGGGLDDCVCGGDGAGWRGGHGRRGRAMGDGRLYADKVVMRWDLRKWGENAANL